MDEEERERRLKAIEEFVMSEMSKREKTERLDTVLMYFAIMVALVFLAMVFDRIVGGNF